MSCQFVRLKKILWKMRENDGYDKIHNRHIKLNAPHSKTFLQACLEVLIPGCILMQFLLVLIFHNNM